MAQPDDGNWQQQMDELTALASIFGQDLRIVAAQGVQLHGEDLGRLAEAPPLDPPPGPWRLDLSLAVHAEPPSGRLSLRLPAAAADGAAGSSITAPSALPRASSYAVRWLLPLALSLRLHPAYPSSAPPEVLGLEALWLAAGQAAALRAQLLSLYEEQPGLPVCFLWAEWLRSSALEHLGLAEALLLPSPSDGAAAAAAAGEAAGAGAQEGTGDSPSRLLHRLLRCAAPERGG